MSSPMPAAGSPKQSRFNRFMAFWLTSPLGSVSGGIVLIRYVGRRSGVRRQLPVSAAKFESGYLIVVGRPEQKNWWRNFTEPGSLEVISGRRCVQGTAVVVPGTSAWGQRLAADYFRDHRGAAKRAGLPRMEKDELPSPEALATAAATLVFVVVTPA